MKVAWFCLQGLGDTLMATPAISRLRELRPDWEIHTITSQQNCHELMSHHPAVDKTRQFRYWSLGKKALFLDLPGLITERYDISFLAFPSARREYHILSALIGAKRRIAHRLGAAGIWNALHSCVPVQAVHNVENNMNLLAAAGLGPQQPSKRHYTVPESWIAPKRDADTIAFHVGSMMYKGNELKRWPLEEYSAAGRAMRKAGFRLVYIAGPNEVAETMRVRDEVDPHAPILQGDIAHVASALSSFGVLVAGDNGIAHLAAAVGTPTVAIFGPTDPLKCRPWGSHVVVVRPSTCPPCFEFSDDRFTCKLNIGARCIQQDVSVEAVTAAIERARTLADGG